MMQRAKLCNEKSTTICRRARKRYPGVPVANRRARRETIRAVKALRGWVILLLLSLPLLLLPLPPLPHTRPPLPPIPPIPLLLAKAQHKLTRTRSPRAILRRVRATVSNGDPKLNMRIRARCQTTIHSAFSSKYTSHYASIDPRMRLRDISAPAVHLSSPSCLVSIELY